MLLIVSPETMAKTAKGESGGQDPKEQFMDNLKKALKGNKLADIAAICYVDICKASTFVPKTETSSSLRYIIPGIENELTEKLFNKENPLRDEEGNIDESLMVDCLHSLFLLSHRKVMSSLFVDCLSPNSPIHFRRVLLRTLLRISYESKEGKSLPWSPTIVDVYSFLSGNLRKLFQEYKTAGHQFIAFRNSNVGGKKVEKQAEKVTIDLEILNQLIELFQSEPLLALWPQKPDGPDDVNDLLLGICNCISLFELPELSNSASNLLVTVHKIEYIARWKPDNPIDGFWRSSSQVTTNLASVLIENTEITLDEINKMISLLEQILRARNAYLESCQITKPDNTSKHLRYEASTKLEIALLIHLCSSTASIVSKCATCFGLLCAEVDSLRLYIDESDNSIFSNYHAYSQFTSVGNLSTGRQAQQKAIRNTLRLVERQTTGNYAAWEAVYNRWHMYTPFVIRNEEITTLDSQAKVADKGDASRLAQLKDKKGRKVVSKSKDIANIVIKDEKEKNPNLQTVPKILSEKKQADVFLEWTNFLGFLSSLAAVTIGQETVILTADKKGKNQVEVKVSVIQAFLQELMEFLVSEIVSVRESAKLVLGNALSPAVYSVLCAVLHDQARSAFGSSGQITFSEATILFVDQAISILKLIVDTTQNSNHFASLGDFDELIITLLKFVRQLTISIPSLQTKHKLCGLIESIMAKSSFITFKNEQQFRSDLADNLMEWTSEFSTKESNLPPADNAQSQAFMKKLIMELDVQAMSAISALLRNLRLPGKDDEVKAATFSKFFTFFTRLLTRCKKDPQSVLTPQLPETTIKSLSFLVTANIEHGLDYFVTMGYHDDFDTRSAFLKVLTNILKEGAEFDMGGDSVDKYYKLLEIVMEPKLDLILSLCEVTPITEADAVCSLLVRIFQANDRTLDLLKASIVFEVSKTESANTLFRLNSMATKLLAAYCKLNGKEYLRIAVGPEIKLLMTNPVPSEMDPSKLPPGQDLATNTQNITKSAERFLNDIQNSIQFCPGPVREICGFLKKVVGDKFPEAQDMSIAGFIFLRYLCPAIIAPDGFGVINAPIQDKDLRRSLVLAVKVLQNLANQVHFVKEPFMECMNPFIDANLPRIKHIFDLYSQLPEDAPELPPIAFTEEQKEEDLGSLHFYINASLEKLSKLYAARPAEKGQANMFTQVTAVLSQLGAPPDLPTKKSAAAAVPISGGSKENAQYEEFMKKMASKNTESIKSKNIYFLHGKSKKGVPLFYYVAKNYKQDIDNDLFFFHCLKTTQPCFDKKYSVVIDLTLFSAENFIPLNWIANFYKVIPSNASENLDSVYIIHPNTYFKKYSKRITKYTGRIQKKITVFSSVYDLFKEVVAEPDCGLPELALNIEKNIQSTFSPVVKTQMNKKSDVEVRMGADTIHIVPLKANPIFGQNCVLLDVIHISELNEITAVKDTEFIVKYAQKSVTFTSKSAGQMIQQLKDAIERYNISRPQNRGARSKAFSPSDVPGILLNMALLNLTSPNHSLRLASYNLLESLCTSFSFRLPSMLLPSNDIGIAKNSNPFVIRISRELAEAEPNITLEFLLESLRGITKADRTSQIFVMDYIKPWLKNIPLFSILSVNNADKQAKSKELITALIAFSLDTKEIFPILLSKIWKLIAKVDTLVDLVIQCLNERALANSTTLGTKNMDYIEDIYLYIASSNPKLISGRIIHIMLDVLTRTASDNIDLLENTDMWGKIEILVRILLTLSYENLICVENYIPELFYIITMVFYSGDCFLRANVHALFINVVHSIFISRVCHPDKMNNLRFLLQEFHSLSSRLHFGVGSLATPIYLSANERDNKLEKLPITMVENVASSLFSVLNCCTAQPTCIDTAWHARWLSLTSQCAFIPNAALQPRAIVAMGILIRSSDYLSDNVIMHLLQLLKNSLAKGKVDLSVAVISCFTHIYEHLDPRSPYFKSFLWIAVSLLQIHDVKLFGASLSFLEATLKTLNETGHLRGPGLAGFCAASRKNYASILDKLDASSGINFQYDFAFGIASTLLKGLRNALLKTATVRTLLALLDNSCEKNGANILGYLAALIPALGDDSPHLHQAFVFYFLFYFRLM